MFIHLLHRDPVTPTSTTIVQNVFPTSSIKRIYPNAGGFAVVIVADYDQNGIGAIKQTLTTFETLAVLLDRLATAHSTGVGKVTPSEMTAATTAASTGTPSTPDGD